MIERTDNQTEIQSILQGDPKYEAIGLEEIYLNELGVLDEAIQNAPTHILVHTYGDPEGPEAHYVLRAVTELLQKIREQNPKQNIVILFASGHQREREPHSTSFAYKKALDAMLASAGIASHELDIRGRIDVVAEAIANDGNEARETRGEIMFLKYFIEYARHPDKLLGLAVNAMAIGRIAHMPRVNSLLEKNGMPYVKTLSMETIFSQFHPNIVDRIISLFPELLKDNSDFANAEAKKLWLMEIDRKGVLTEKLAKLAGTDLKETMSRLLHQPTT